MVWELLQGCVYPLYMAEVLLCYLILHGDRLTHHFTHQKHQETSCDIRKMAAAVKVG